MMSPVPFSTRWLLEGFYTNGLLVRRAFRRSRSPGAWPQAALAFLAKVHRACRTGREAALRLGRLMGWAEGYGLMGRF